jgi:hypothetical protein
LEQELASVDTNEHALHELWKRLHALRATLRMAVNLAEEVRQMEGLKEEERIELNDAVATAYQTATEYTLNVQVQLEQDVVWG